MRRRRRLLRLHLPDARWFLTRHPPPQQGAAL
jgi:hypothetical protein